MAKLLTPAQIARLPYRLNTGIMLVNPAGRVFVGERLDSPEAWQMPQGGIDAGEDPRQAALRELREETSIPPALVQVQAELPDWVAYDLPLELVPKLWKGRYRGQKQRWFLMRFQGADADIDIQTRHPEFSRWQWLEPEALLARIVPFKRPVYEQVLRGFGPDLKQSILPKGPLSS